MGATVVPVPNNPPNCPLTPLTLPYAEFTEDLNLNLFVIGYIFQIPNSAQSRKEEELGNQSKNVKYLVQGALTFPSVVVAVIFTPVVPVVSADIYPM